MAFKDRAPLIDATAWLNLVLRRCALQSPLFSAQAFTWNILMKSCHREEVSLSIHNLEDETDIQKPLMAVKIQHLVLIDDFTMADSMMSSQPIQFKNTFFVPRGAI